MSRSIFHIFTVPSCSSIYFSCPPCPRVSTPILSSLKHQFFLHIPYSDPRRTPLPSSAINHLLSPRFCSQCIPRFLFWSFFLHPLLTPVSPVSNSTSFFTLRTQTHVIYLSRPFPTTHHLPSLSSMSLTLSHAFYPLLLSLLPRVTIQQCLTSSRHTLASSHVRAGEEGAAR